MALAEHENLPVAAARSGDPESWNALFRRYQLPLYVYAMDRLRDEQSALDTVQEAFVSAVRNLAQLRSDAKFGSWLFAIVHQKCAQKIRRGGREELFVEEDAPEMVDAADPATALERREDQELFMAALDALPESDRAVLVLHYLESFPLDEIGEILGIPLGTVKSRLHHARGLLRQRLGGKPIHAP